MAHCVHCGASTSQSNRFCAQCGARAFGEDVVGHAKVPASLARIHRICFSTLIVWTSFWLADVIAGMASIPKHPEVSGIANLIALGVVGSIWFVPALVLCLIAIATKPMRSVPWPDSTKAITGVLSGLASFAAILLVFAAQPDQTQTARRVTYVVDCDQSSSSARCYQSSEVTYQNASGGTEQKRVTLPWALEIRERSGSFAYVSAQTPYEYAFVHVAIYVDGQVLREATSTVSEGIASAGGSVP